MRIPRQLKFVLSILALLAAGPVWAGIGKVVEVRPGATLTVGGKTQRIAAGMEIDSGDLIRTDRKGVVQLIFSDDTKIAVGPNARMVVDVSMMRGNKRARNFAVKALGGSFRFISGNSSKDVYKIETPNATMGIRGTAFDFWVDGENKTAVTLLSGRVNMCHVSGACQVVRGRCSMALTSNRDRIERLRNDREAVDLIESGFPFILNESLVREDFRTEAGGCGRVTALFNAEPKTPIAPPPEPPPAPLPEPVPEPEPTPEPEPEPSLGYPGNSGPGPSYGRGGPNSRGKGGNGRGPDKGRDDGGPGRGKGNGNGNGHAERDR